MKIASAILFAIALALGQAMQGGAQIPALSLPSFALVVVAAALALPGAFRAPAAALPLASSLTFLGYLIWRTLQPDADPLLAQIDLSSALACGLALVATASGFPDNRARLWLLGSIGVVLALQLGIGLAQFTMGGDWMPAGWFSGELRHLYGDRFAARTRGSFLNPNHFAWAMATGCLMTLAFAVWGRLAAWARILMIYFAGTFLVGVVLAASRGCIIALGAGLLVFGAVSLVGITSVTRKGSRSILAIGGLILLIVGGSGLYVYESAWAAQSRFQEMLVPGVRSAFAEVAWRSFQTNPIVGTGPGEFLYAARSLRQPTASGDPMYAHNDWLQLLSEYGWIGFSLALISMVLLIGNGLARFHNGLLSRIKDGQKPFSNESALAIGCVSCVVLFASHSVVDFNFHIPANALLAAILIGLLAGGHRSNNAPYARTHRMASRILAALGFLGFGGGLIFHLLATAEPNITAIQARNAMSEGDAPKALKLAESTLAKYPDDPQLLWIEAQSAANFESSLMLKANATAPEMPAMDKGEPTLDMDSEKDFGYGLIGVLSEEESEAYLTRALEIYHRLAKIRPRERKIHLEIGLALVRKGDFDGAERAILTGIEHDSWSGYPLSIYGEVSDMAGNRTTAVQIFTMGTRMPDNQSSVLNLQRIQSEEEVLRQLEAEGFIPEP